MLPKATLFKCCLKAVSTICNSIPTSDEKNPFENIARKGENAGSQHFLLFRQCFLNIQRKFQCFSNIYFFVY